MHRTCHYSDSRFLVPDKFQGCQYCNLTEPGDCDALVVTTIKEKQTYCEIFDKTTGLTNWLARRD